tara:strand:+ start:1200 stop:1418 length:219 start_codon:yes stop_codon:yes gene_type:complete
VVEVESAVADFAFEPLDELVIEDMLDLIDGPIHMRWRDVGAGDEVLLPEHVVPVDAATAFKASLGECAGDAE